MLPPLNLQHEATQGWLEQVSKGGIAKSGKDPEDADVGLKFRLYREGTLWRWNKFLPRNLQL